MDMNQIYTILKRYNKRKLEDDTIQELAIHIWENRDAYDASRGKITTWVYRIVKNHLIDKSRSKKEKEINLTNPLSSYEMEGKDGIIHSSIDLQLISDTLSPLDVMIHQEEKKELIDGIYELKGNDREILLAYLDGKYDSSSSTQRARLSRAKEAIMNKDKKEAYLLINLRNQEQYKVGTLKEAAEITGLTIEGIRYALNNSGLFLKKTWRISKY